MKIPNPAIDKYVLCSKISVGRGRSDDVGMR